MIKNSTYTFNYHQPLDYRFSLDSVFLAQKVAALLKDSQNLSAMNFLDLCSGCGVIGLELYCHLNAITKMDFVEIQEVYLPYFEKNLALINPEASEFNFLNLNYEQMLTIKDYNNKYDIIVSNPPYFFIDEGLQSPNQFKNRCRFFIDSSFDLLIEAILKVLKNNGRAYLLMRPGNHHGRDLLDETKKLSANRALVKILDEVRGTNIVEITKII